MGYPITVAMLADAMDPERLEVWARALPEKQAQRIHHYLDSLSGEQKRGLAGTRDRLAILAESDLAPISGVASRPATTSTSSPPSSAATRCCSASTQTAGRCWRRCSPPRSSRTC